MAELQVLHHPRGVHRGGGRQEMLRPEPRCCPVVQNEAVLAQHDAVTGSPHRQGREGVDVDAVEEFSGVRPLDVDLAQGRDVGHADVGTRVAGLAGRGVEPVPLSVAREPLRPDPLPRFGEGGAPGLRPAVAGRAPVGAEIHAPVGAREGRDRHGDRGRPGDRGSGIAEAPARQLGHDRLADDRAGLALIGGHAQRGVAFQMLERAESLLLGKGDVLCGDVVLKVDERDPAHPSTPPERLDAEALLAARGRGWARGREPRLFGGPGARSSAVGKRLG